MSEITFVSSVLAILPAAYIFHKFYRLNKGIHQYTQQVKSLSTVPSPDNLQPNLTLVHCKRCDSQESETVLPEVVSQ